MIKSFADKETQEIFEGIHRHSIKKRFPAVMLKTIERRLDILNAADSLETLSCIPGFKGEGATRDTRGKYKIPVQNNWRLLFRWEKEGPSEVELQP